MPRLRRLLLSPCALVAVAGALALPVTAGAQPVGTTPLPTQLPTVPTAPSVPTTPTVPTVPTTPTAPTPLPAANSLHVRGTVTALSWASFTIRAGGRPMSTLNALTAAANAVSGQDLPYVYGGGHAAAGTASIGIKGGPGYNGRRIGYDCSGSVGAVLAGAGVWPAGSPVPADNGVIAQLRQEHLIARGVGGPASVTLYDDPGVHIFMSIEGRFFGTSDGGEGSPLANHGGPTWLDDGAPDASSRAYHAYHLLGSVLAARTTYGPTMTFAVGADPALLSELVAGQRVAVTYDRRANGTLTAVAAG